MKDCSRLDLERSIYVQFLFSVRPLVCFAVSDGLTRSGPLSLEVRIRLLCDSCRTYGSQSGGDDEVDRAFMP